MKSPEKPYVIRLVFDSEGEGEDDVDFERLPLEEGNKYEPIPFDNRQHFENFQNVLETHGIQYSTQAPIEGPGGTGR